MRLDRFAGILLATGAIVGVVAIVGLAVGFEPSRLPPRLLDIAAYKLTFGAAGVLLAIGAIVRRHTRGNDAEASNTFAQSRVAAHDASAPAELPLPRADQDFVGGIPKSGIPSDVRIPKER
jgi:hypothetical protein